MNGVNKHIGIKLKEARLGKRMSREQLARRIGTAQQTVEKYEIGAIDISVVRLLEISDILGVKIIELIN